MPEAAGRGLIDSVNSLFGTGTLSGLSDGQLLERFTSGEPSARELAFEALVLRHGPMVTRLCQSGLRDPQDVHDAIQAVFLVLARRAGSIQRHDSVASWLYGVALRVVARARVSAARRRVRDERTTEAAEKIANLRGAQTTLAAAEANELAEVVHQELGRLPERYRTPILLCYAEGLTHDQAAARLDWPVGTVRSRLARGRDRLRSRLARRGISHPTAMAPIFTSAGGVSLVSTAPPAIPRALAITTARAVISEAARTSRTAAIVQNASVVLAEGVMKMLILRRIVLVSCVMIPVVLATLGGGLFLVRASQNRAQEGAGVARVVERLPLQTPADAARAKQIEQLSQKLLEATRTRYDMQKHLYQNGRAEVDRVLEGATQLELVELRFAKSAADRQKARSLALKRFEEIELLTKARVEAARSSAGALSEATQRRVEAELDLLVHERDQDDPAALVDRMKALEHRMDAIEKGAK
jgi:RNA polymerase sigma factor (sigma-70 family)